MSKLTAKKLVLKRQVVRELSQKDLNNAVGGMRSPTDSCAEFDNCNPTRTGWTGLQGCTGVCG